MARKMFLEMMENGSFVNRLCRFSNHTVYTANLCGPCGTRVRRYNMY